MSCFGRDSKGDARIIVVATEGDEGIRQHADDILDAQSKDDLRLLPSNHFEALIGDRKGQFSIRINQQWRLCFEWSESENRAFNIEVADYH